LSEQPHRVRTWGPRGLATFACVRHNARDRQTYPEAIRAMDPEGRKDPETLIGPVPEPKKGRLKVYVGGAAGVGKTYRMLEEAHHLCEQGHDVVLGFVETHGRAETAARIGDLETVPLRKISYRSAILEEMDVDAIVARKPEFAVVDELAHTNASGSRHNKRYQDVEELLGNGINVIGALNVSLNRMVLRITGVEIKGGDYPGYLSRPRRSGRDS
jgi:two-component system sensor histidine kinase KdpD